jgi:hypothetical protein
LSRQTDGEDTSSIGFTIREIKYFQVSTLQEGLMTSYVCLLFFACLRGLPHAYPCLINVQDKHNPSCTDDEGMTNGPPIFAHLVFGPERVSLERLLRPMRAAFQRGPGAKLGVQVRTQRIQVRLDFVYLRSDPICTWLKRQS